MQHDAERPAWAKAVYRTDKAVSLSWRERLTLLFRGTWRIRAVIYLDVEPGQANITIWPEPDGQA